MKKLILLFLSFSYSAFSQTLPYVLDTRVETYSTLSGASVLSTDPSTVSLPFSFQMLAAHSSAKISLDSDGLVDFSTGGNDMVASLSSGFSGGTVSYVVDGTAPNRILKVEWSNVVFTYSSTTADYVTYQMWFYEGSNIIEWHFGANNYIPATSGPSTPLLIVFYGTSAHTISGSPTAPVFTACGFSCHLNDVPVSGTIYRLIPAAIAGTTELSDEYSLNCYPNPCSGRFTIETEMDWNRVQVMNSVGQLVFSGKNESNELDIRGMPAGIYLLTISGERGILKKRLVIE